MASALGAQAYATPPFTSFFKQIFINLILDIILLNREKKEKKRK
jgi:hypothetical protein